MSGLIVVIGSGELGGSMRSTHRQVFDRTGARSVTVLDTSYGFQENADALTSRITKHFESAFGVKSVVASLRRPPSSHEESRRFLDTIATSEVVFGGPGSPSYALRVWSGMDVRGALMSVIERGGAVVMASAAALTLGVKAIPVYEIYKVGDDPHWLEGLNLLASIGIDAAVVPHWNNREGGFHDTSHCFIGERRFLQLVEMLSPSSSILGVDEHTSVLIDSTTRVMHVLGKGGAYLNDRRVVADQELGTPSTRPASSRFPLASEEQSESPDGDSELIDLLVELRSEARNRGNFEESDRIRDALAAADVEVHDLPDRTTWTRRQ
jgi:cyanophycinase-like exopeptidase